MAADPRDLKAAEVRVVPFTQRQSRCWALYYVQCTRIDPERGQHQRITLRGGDIDLTRWIARRRRLPATGMTNSFTCVFRERTRERVRKALTHASHARSTQVGHDVQGSFCIPQDTCTQLDTRYSYYYYKASGPLVLCLVVGRLGVEGGGGGVEGVAVAVVCVLFG